MDICSVYMVLGIVCMCLLSDINGFFVYIRSSNVEGYPCSGSILYASDTTIA